MPSIYLKETKSQYNTGSGKVTVACEPYQNSNLFTRYKHTPTSDKPWKPGEKIKISDNKSTSSLTLSPDGEYVKKQLSHAYVYFNRYDTSNKKPLLLSLHFKKDIPEGKGFYFQYMEIEALFTYKRPLDISYMTDFENDKELFEYLLLENDSNNSLTYLINRTNNKGNDINYNLGTISISQKQNIENGQSNGFYKYTHTPKYGPMKSYVLYNKDVLVKKGTEPIEEIQGQVYSSITVYFGTRAKTSGRGRNQKDIPLLIELTKTSSSNNPDYYVHKRNSSGYYWQSLPGPGGMALENLLVDMGFGMSKGDNGYEQLKQLLEGAGVNGGIGDGADLSDKLNEVKGSKLQKLLDQKVGQQPGDSGTGSQKSFLELLLTQIEFDLLDSVVILLGKNGTNGTTYGDSDVSGVVGQLKPKRHINRVSMNGGQNIQVSNETTSGSNGLCVKPYSYKLIKHDFGALVSSFGSNGQPAAGIRFIIPSQTDGYYHQLKLYDKDKPYPQNLQYTYYSTGQEQVYVYFYGEKDPRPLLVCYNGCAYKPKKPRDPIPERQVIMDYSIWEKVTGISTCTCSGAETSVTNKAILDALNDVVGFLNPVQINPKQIPDGACTQITGKSGGKAEYNLHTYNTKTIKMGITREDVGCYDKYTYQPYGTTSGPAEGFRLGTVLHAKTSKSTQRSPLNYTSDSPSNKYHPVVAVTVYYYDEDDKYDDPLLIELEFKKNGGGGDGTGPKEYYKLKPSSGGDTLQWEKDDNAKLAINGGGDGNEKLIAYLDGIRHSLKKVIKILLDKHEQYPLCVSTKPGGQGNEYTPKGDTNIQVQACTEGACSKLSESGYKCYVHKVSEINEGVRFDYNR